MRIAVSGESVETREGITVAELIVERKVKNPEYVLVGLNGEILNREEHSTTILSEGDDVDFLYYMGGGAS